MTTQFRKNWGNRLDRNKFFVDRDDVLKEFKANEQIEVENVVKYQRDDSISNEYNQNSKQTNDEIKDEVLGMMFGNEELMDVYPNTNVIRYIDKDNYLKYLNLKGNLNFLVVISNVYFWAIYSIIVLILGCIEVLRMVNESNLVFISNVAESILEEVEQLIGEINPNWGFISIPLMIYTIYKLFNSYSYIKISF
jgi:hypothetical protein